MKLSKKKILIYLATVALALVLTVTAVFGYAYFSKREIYEGYLSGQVELLFDRLDENGIADYGTAEGVTADMDAEWGTKENPYVISNVRHLYNLSELQNIGYFYKQFIKSSDGEPENTTRMPYFLVCEPDYTPVVIDGSKFREITAIGNDDYPFIGSVKGVHIETKDAEGNPINQDEMVTVGSEKSATSVIHNVSVKGNPGAVDSGLFGYVSFLGTPPEEGSGVTTFEGMPSTLSNLVLSDVTVTLKSTLWDAVTEFVKDIALGEGGHRYSFTELYGVTDANGNPLNIYDTVPHENHHIGILAGHVSYSIVEYISVFYSSDNIVAMDLSDANKVGGVKANYMSATGIIGFIYNLNPTVNEDGTLTAGSGDSVSDLSYSMVGGGGEAVGDKAGYILAKNIFDKYTHIADQNGNLTENTAETIKISTATMADGTPLCYQSVRDMGILGEQIGYYFYDGVFTFALSSDEDVIEQTWKDEIDGFNIGSTDRSQWVNTYTKDKLAVAAFLSPVTSDMMLQSAASLGKPIVIVKENGEIASFMSLFTQSPTTAAGLFTGLNNHYTTDSDDAAYGTRGETGLLADLINGYNDRGSDEDYYYSTFKQYGESDMARTDIDNMMSEIKNENTAWKVINVGTPVEGSKLDSLEDLRDYFKIVAHNQSDYVYFAGAAPIVFNNDNTITNYFDYSKPLDDGTLYDGYFYYTSTWQIIRTVYTYYYQYQNTDNVPEELRGKVITVAENSRSAPGSFFTSNGTNWHGETIYSRTENGVTYTGVIVEQGDKEFYSGNQAIISGPVLLKPTDGSVGCFYRTIGTDTYKYGDGSSKGYTIDNLTDTGKKTPSGNIIYAADGKEGILVDRYPTYTFASTSDLNTANILHMIQGSFGLLGTQSAIWNGTNKAANTASNFKINYLLGNATASNLTAQPKATVKFNPDGTCYLQYSIGNTTQYVGYNSSLGSYCGASIQDESTKLKIYVLEATQNINFGNTTFSPTEGTGHSFAANEHLLYATTDANGNTFYEVMDVTKLPNLGNPEAFGWKSGNAADGTNGILSSKDLTKKFRTKNGINFGLVLNAFGTQYGTNGIITAPVGKLGTYADIPLSCVAFRVNKEGTQHVRVIISVAVSDFYVGEDPGANESNTLGESRRFFNMWQINESGSQTLDWFSKNGAAERFEIPISHPYSPEATPTSEEGKQGFYTVKYDSNADGTPEDYGMYMNGDRILVAYEFTVNEVGLYILGPSGFSLNNNGSMNTSIFDQNAPDVPMEIVYFSADGVASAGRDGASASQIGTIDYVYSYGGEIVTVTDTSESGSDGNEDYSNYYPSYVLTYFENTKKVDGEFISINNERVKIRRYVATDGTPPTSTTGYNQMNSLSAIHYVIGGDRHANIVQYARFSDNVIKEEEQ